MGFERLRFFNFRNLKDRELSLGARQVFLVGQNGQGKTNLLEAVHLLSVGSSFREKRDAALSRNPAETTGLFGAVSGPGDRSVTLSLQFSADRRKELRVDEKTLSDRRGLLSEVLCLCFVQQDMDFIVGSPEERRRFFDQTLVLCDLSFLDALRSYRLVLRSRNLCLREQRDDLLDVYDAQLAAQGLILQNRRAELVRDFDARFGTLLGEISGTGQDVRIRYRPSWDGLSTTDEVMDHLAGRRERDRLMGVTTSGPHRDLCSYVREGGEYSHFASTGQLRLCALALRVAQARYLSERTSRTPVLLVDDVLLELDPGKKSAFLARFPSYDQVFFTFLPDEAWRSYCTPDTLVLEVEAGDFRAVSAGPSGAGP
jgi:DNA replication and repair protein RecF